MTLITEQDFAEVFRTVVDNLKQKMTGYNRVPTSISVVTVGANGYDVDVVLLNDKALTQHLSTTGAGYGANRQVVCAAIFIVESDSLVAIIGNVLNQPLVTRALRPERDEKGLITSMTEGDAPAHTDRLPLDAFWTGYAQARLATSPDPNMQALFRAWSNRN